VIGPRKPSTHRGTADNPPNRFEPIHLERDAEWDPNEDPLPRTQFLRDLSQTIISYNDSPDIAFRAAVNPYRGCEHGCIYCYARPTHEYLGFSSGLDFETKIMVKPDAPELLRTELASHKWVPQVVAMCGVTDAYQPVERRLRLTRGCLEVLAECRNPVAIVTKNRLVTRDIDLLATLARDNAAVVYLSLTTLDTNLRGVMEPRTSPPAARLAAMRELTRVGVPVGVLVAPVIPGLTEPEIPALLEAAAEAGARFASYVVLRLPHALAPLFEQWLATHVPERKARVLNRIRAVRDGRLNDSQFERRMEGQGLFADQIRQLFEVGCRRNGLNASSPDLSTAAFRRPELGGQMPLFA
jgi:DNA repair photolyase